MKYEVCMNVFSMYVFSNCGERSPKIRTRRDLSFTHTQACTIVAFGELAVRAALGFSLLTCTLDTSDIVKLVQLLNFERLLRGIRGSSTASAAALAAFSRIVLKPWFLQDNNFFLL